MPPGSELCDLGFQEGIAGDAVAFVRRSERTDEALPAALDTLEEMARRYSPTQRLSAEDGGALLRLLLDGRGGAAVEACLGAHAAAVLAAAVEPQSACAGALADIRRERADAARALATAEAALQ